MGDLRDALNGAAAAGASAADRLALLSESGGGGGAPTTADYLVKTANAGLSVERVVTDTTSITVDWGTAGQAKFVREALTGDVTAAQGSNTTAIAALALSKLADASVGLSVVGRTANSTGVHADIGATAASDAVLRESGSVLGFGTIATGGIAANAVTNAKLGTMAANTIKGNNTGGAATPSDLTASQVAAMLAGLVTPADTSKVLASGTSTIAADTCRSIVRRYTIASGAHLVVAATGSFEVRS